MVSKQVATFVLLITGTAFILIIFEARQDSTKLAWNTSDKPIQITDINSELGKKLINRMATKVRDRLGVIAYLPPDEIQLYNFIPMLYGSWRYIIEHQNELILREELNEINDVDLLIFCHSVMCKHIKKFCTLIKNITQLGVTNSLSRCWAIEEPFVIDIPYGPINAFVMFNRTDINKLIPKYKFILRTDNDVFLSPAIYKLKPKRFMYGQGGYSDIFNMERLKVISKKLGLIHRGVHYIGSTWCGDTAQFLKAGRLTLNVTRHLYLYEFNPSDPALKTINFTMNREGEWIRWWRPVSSMYGGEIALNHVIKDLSEKDKGNLDSSSCDASSIWRTPHIHCWHGECEFQKFRFIKFLNFAVRSKDNVPGEVAHRMIENIYKKDVRNMTLQQYSTYIAWNSVSKYLREWFVK